jgi:lipopolysaccharide export system protein LptA
MRRCKPATARAERDQGANKVPRLLKTDAPVIIRAQDLEYDSRTGTAIYTDTGRSARLDQGDETAISGERISIDQTKGDLTVTGNAISTLMLDNKLTTGRGHEIRYTDEKRLITYASAAKAGSAEVSLVSGPGSRLQAGSIDITLNAKDNALDTMRAIRNVRIVEGENTVTGGTRLDYTSSTGQYVVNGSSSTPVSIVQNGGDGCRQFSGNSITFNKENDKPLVIDGQQVRNAGTAPSKAVCTPVPAR